MQPSLPGRLPIAGELRRLIRSTALAKSGKAPSPMLDLEAVGEGVLARRGGRLAHLMHKHYQNDRLFLP